MPSRMFTTHSSGGFYYAPVCKFLLGLLVVSTVVTNMFFHNYRHYFRYTVSDITEQREFWRLFISKVSFLDPKDLLCAAMLLYNFRVFERRYGSRKFASYLVVVSYLSMMLEVAILITCHYTEIQLDNLPSGPYSLIFSMFVPYFCDIPRVAMTHVLGIPVTGKSLAYLVGLQMCSDSLEGVMMAACGIFAGLLYRSNFLHIQTVFGIPQPIASLCQRLMGSLLESRPQDGSMLPMGATIELQNQQHLERLEQQMMLAQLQQAGMQQRHAANFLPGLFGNQQQQNSMYHQQQEPAQQQQQQQDEQQPADQGTAQPQQGPSSSRQSPPEENQIQTLVDMGFNRDSAVGALQVSNNNVQLATNLLLQQS